MSWRSATIGDLVALQRGHDLPATVRNPGTVPVVGSAGPNGFHDVALVRGPGVTIGRSGGSIGKVTFTAQDFWPHNTCIYVTDFKGNNPRFVSYLLDTLNLAQLNSGAAQPSLNRNFVYGVKIRFPSPDEQQRIADTLAAHDDLIENNRHRIQLLQRAARLLYKEWFVYLRFPGHEHVKIIDGVPEGWDRKAIGEVCETVGGGTPSTKKPEYWEDGHIPWVIPTDVTRNGCTALLSSEKRITQAGLQGSSAKMVPPETILMTSRASVGFFALMEQEVCSNQGFINIIPNNDETRMYMLHNLMYRVEEIRSHAGGSTYKEISKGRFRNLTIVMPPLALCHEFNEIAYLLLQQTRSLLKQNANLVRARDLLLPRLMNGGISI